MTAYRNVHNAIIVFSCILLLVATSITGFAYGQTDPDPNAARLAQAQADKAVADAEKARWDAEAAASQAREAAATAKASEAASKIGTVAPSGVAGSIEVKDGAGKGPATILATSLLGALADEIAIKVNAAKVVILSGTEDGQLAELQAFNVRKALIIQQFARAKARMQEAADADQASTRGFVAGMPVAAAGAILSAAANLGSYFKSDYSVGDVTLTPDDSLLAAVVAQKLRDAGKTVYLSSRTFVPDVDVVLTRLFGNLSAGNDEAAQDARVADRRAKGLRDRIGTIKGDSSGTVAERARLSALASKWEDAAAASKSASAEYQAFMTSMFTADAAGLVPLGKVIRQEIVVSSVGRDGVVLFLKVASSPAGYYTKKNLWTFLGGMPYYVTGGQVVSYAVVKTDGSVDAAGVLVRNSGFRKATDIAKFQLDQNPEAEARCPERCCRSLPKGSGSGATSNAAACRDRDCASAVLCDEGVEATTQPR